MPISLDQIIEMPTEFKVIIFLAFIIGASATIPIFKISFGKAVLEPIFSRVADIFGVFFTWELFVMAVISLLIAFFILRFNPIQIQ